MIIRKWQEIMINLSVLIQSATAWLGTEALKEKFGLCLYKPVLTKEKTQF